MKTRADTTLILLLAALLFSGALVFSSAALGLLARGETHISSVVFNHFVMGIGGGLFLFFLTFSIDYKRWQPLAPYIFGLALVATALVFVPGIGMEHGGGRRWLDFGFTTLQPAELLKLATILFAAFWFTRLRDMVAAWQGLIGLGIILAFPIILLMLQPDLGTLGIISISVFAMYLAAGARIRDVAIIGATVGIVLLGLSFTPRFEYAFERIETFMNPELQNALGEGFQIRQSLIAIGSGEIFGRGFGQSVQKFTYLPEPMGDSIYAVLAEEFGFAGAATLIVLFLVLALKGYGIAARAPDFFGGLLAVGISTYLVGGAFINIAAMLGMVPLTGEPLTFISQGGTAMLFALTSAGILLNISKRQAKKA